MLQNHPFSIGVKQYGFFKLISWVMGTLLFSRLQFHHHHIPFFWMQKCWPTVSTRLFWSFLRLLAQWQNMGPTHAHIWKALMTPSPAHQQLMVSRFWVGSFWFGAKTRNFSKKRNFEPSMLSVKQKERPLSRSPDRIPHKRICSAVTARNLVTYKRNAGQAFKAMPP